MACAQKRDRERERMNIDEWVIFRESTTHTRPPESERGEKVDLGIFGPASLDKRRGKKTSFER